MSEQNIISVVSGGIMTKGVVCVKVQNKKDFEKTLPNFEEYYSDNYNGWKSPIIKDLTIEIIKDRIYIWRGSHNKTI